MSFSVKGLSNDFSTAAPKLDHPVEDSAMGAPLKGGAESGFKQAFGGLFGSDSGSGGGISSFLKKLTGGGPQGGQGTGSEPSLPEGGHPSIGGSPAQAQPSGGEGGAPASASTPGASSSGAASSSGSAPQSGGSDLDQAMAATQQKDPTLFAKTIKDGQDGDGNSLVEDELQAYKNGDISQQQSIDEVSGAQSLANNNGGGKINGHVKSDAQAALGGSYINGGQTRAGHAITKGLESFTGIGAIVGGIKDKTSKQSETILDAAQPEIAQGSQQAMQDMAEADPERAQKFQQDAKAGDGNSMVQDMVQLKQEEQAGQVPDTFTDQDAQMLGSQVGTVGKGKVNSQEDQAFTQAFGTDTLFRGSTRGSKIFNKIENGASNFMQQIVSPVTDTVGGVDDLAHGNVKGAFSQFGQAVVGAATDATMVVAPEAAPEIEAGEIAARSGAGVAKAAGSSTSSTLNSILDGAKMIKKGNDYYNDANTAVNYVTGSGNNGQNN
jgi:hypothetical protein